MRNWFYRKLLVRIFGEVSTKTFREKEAGAITLFDAYEHFSK